jgi:hypothetical protein
LNQPNSPRDAPWSRGRRRIVAHKAGVRIIATSTDRTIADTMVTENWR